MTGVERCYQYCKDVETHKILTNRYVQLAVKRFRKDIERSKNDPEFPYVFDEEKANRFIEFTEHLKQYQDQWKGQELKLENWQCFCFTNIYGWINKDTGFRRFRKAFIFVARKNGKDVDLNTSINTPLGQKIFRDIHPGDYVFSEEGIPVKVLWESEIFQNNPCYKLTFNNGDEVVAGEGHLWTVSHGKLGRAWDKERKGNYGPYVSKTLTTKELYDYVVHTNKTKATYKSHPWKIQLPKPLEYPTKDLTIDPYTLGVWLGDGTSKSAELNLNVWDHDEIMSNIPYSYVETFCDNGNSGIWCVNLTGKKYTKEDRTCHHNVFKDTLRDMNLINNKHIPEEYFSASYEQRLSLLQGLMDTDGSILKDGKGGIGFSNERLALDVFRLLNTLGIRYKEKHYNAHYKGCEKEFPTHEANFYTSLPVVRLRRKLERMRVIKRAEETTIVNIEPVETRPTKCIAVDNPTGLFCIGKHNTVTHNSHMVASTLLYDLLTTNGAMGFCAATKRDQSKLVFNVCVEMIKQNDALSKRLNVYKSTSRIVNEAKAGYIEALSAESDSFDGLSPSCVVVDEVSAMKDYNIIKVLASGQGARPEALMLEITSGNDNLTSAGKQEYDISKDILEGTKEDESFFCLLYCLDEGDDWKDPKNFIKSNPNLNVSIKEDWLRKQLQEALNNPSLEGEFRTKNLNQFINPLKSWIRPKIWEQIERNTLTHKLDLSKPYYAVGAIDLSKRNDLTAFTVCIYQNNYYYLQHRLFFPLDSLKEKITKDNEQWMKWVERGLVSGTPGRIIDYDYVKTAIEEAHEKYDLQAILFDPYNHTKLIDDTEALPWIEVNQSMKYLSPFVKATEEEIFKGKVVDNNPVSKWQFLNAEVYRDPNDNQKIVKPDMKKDSGKRIDAVITSCMAIGYAKQQVEAGEIDLRSDEERQADLEKMLASLNI